MRVGELQGDGDRSGRNLGKGQGEYDQNILYEIFKKLIKYYIQT